MKESSLETALFFFNIKKYLAGKNEQNFFATLTFNGNCDKIYAQNRKLKEEVENNEFCTYIRYAL